MQLWRKGWWNSSLTSSFISGLMRRRSVVSIFKHPTPSAHNIFIAFWIIRIYEGDNQCFMSLFVRSVSQLELCCWSSVGWRKRTVRPSLLVSCSILRFKLYTHVDSYYIVCFYFVLQLLILQFHHLFTKNSVQSISGWSREEISVWVWLWRTVCGVDRCHY